MIDPDAIRPLIGNEGIQIAVSVQVAQSDPATGAAAKALPCSELSITLVEPDLVGSSAVGDEGVHIIIAVQIAQGNVLTGCAAQTLGTVNKIPGTLVEPDPISALVGSEYVQVIITIQVGCGSGIACGAPKGLTAIEEYAIRFGSRAGLPGEGKHQPERTSSQEEYQYSDESLITFRGKDSNIHLVHQATTNQVCGYTIDKGHKEVRRKEIIP